MISARLPTALAHTQPAAEPSAPVLDEETGDLSELLLEAMNRANTLEEGDHE